jgi:hypothetical protein
MIEHLFAEQLTVVIAAQAIPAIESQNPPGFDKILEVVGYVRAIAGAAIIACFLAGIVAFTGGRMFDHHHAGRIGLYLLMAAGVGALLFAIGPELLNELAGAA